MILISLLASLANILAPIQPKVIYFDFGGVMASPDRQMQLAYLVEKLGFPAESLQDSPYFRWMQLHPSEIDYLTQKALEYQILLTPERLEEYRKVKRNSIHEIPGMLELVKHLRQMHYEVDLITNIRPENLDLIEPFRNMFDHIVHCPKDPGERQEAWEMEWMQHGFNPSQLMLIDDQEANVDEAQKLGIQAIQFETVDAILKELVNRGILSEQLEFF
ncbi:MAG TPA: HAD hydrolase-like protein [Chlamydiales bacterium]|nr:HAD hydrolase-like protein [Chlamydiales bacterium]